MFAQELAALMEKYENNTGQIMDQWNNPSLAQAQSYNTQPKKELTEEEKRKYQEYLKNAGAAQAMGQTDAKRYFNDQATDIATEHVPSFMEMQQMSQGDSWQPNPQLKAPMKMLNFNDSLGTGASTGGGGTGTGFGSQFWSGGGWVGPAVQGLTLLNHVIPGQTDNGKYGAQGNAINGLLQTGLNVYNTVQFGKKALTWGKYYNAAKNLKTGADVAQAAQTATNATSGGISIAGELAKDAASPAITSGVNTSLQVGNTAAHSAEIATTAANTVSHTSVAANLGSKAAAATTAAGGSTAAATAASMGTSIGVGLVGQLGGMALGKGVEALGGGTDGMCVCAGTKVFTADGNVVNVENLKQEDGIIGWSEDVKQTIPQTIAVLIEPRQKQCVEIKLESGQKLRCSIDHPILSDISNNKRSPKKWIFRQVGKLRKGDFVGLANSIDYWGNDILDDAYKIGSTINKNAKKLPDNLFSLDRNSVCELIAGLFDDCGKIFVDTKTDKIVLTFMMHNYYTIREIKILLHKLGIFSYIKSWKNNNKLRIYDYNSIIEFYNNIHLRTEDKQNLLDKVYKFALSKEDPEQSYFTGAKATRIVYIKSIGVQTVYNLQANDDHTYIANGIITHNTIQDSLMGNSAWGLAGSMALTMGPVGAIAGATLAAASMINGFGGRTTDTITKDTETFEQVGGSYGGTESKVDEALMYSGKKYGLYSRGAYKKAQRKIREAKRQQNLVGDIAEEARNSTDMMDYMGNMYANQYQTELAGGYDQSDGIHIGKQGMKLQVARDMINIWKDTPMLGRIVPAIKEYDNNGVISLQPDSKYNLSYINPIKIKNDQNKASDIIGDINTIAEDSDIISRLKKGGQLIGGHIDTDKESGTINIIAGYTVKSIQQYKGGGKTNDVQEEQVSPYDPERFIKSLLEHSNKIPNFIKRITDEPYVRTIEFINPNTGKKEWGSHFISSRELDGKEVIYPLIQQIEDGGLKFFNQDEAFGRALRNGDYLIVDTPEEAELFGKYYKKYFDDKFGPASNIFLFEHENYILTDFEGTPLFKKGGTIQENVPVQPLEDKGGDTNVVPQGALHARLNHIEDNELTKKGIPVVSNDGVQQAEIENSEIILRLALTERIEQLSSQYEKAENDDDKDRAAIEAGKLLVDEILYNTIDNTKKII